MENRKLTLSNDRMIAGFSSGAAVIDSQCFYVSAMYSASNQETVVALCNQVMASIRPW